MVVVILEFIEKVTFRDIISAIALIGRLFALRESKGRVKVGSVFSPMFP